MLSLTVLWSHTTMELFSNSLCFAAVLWCWLHFREQSVNGRKSPQLNKDFIYFCKWTFVTLCFIYTINLSSQPGLFQSRFCLPSCIFSVQSTETVKSQRMYCHICLELLKFCVDLCFCERKLWEYKLSEDLAAHGFFLGLSKNEPILYTFFLVLFLFSL